MGATSSLFYLPIGGRFTHRTHSVKDQSASTSSHFLFMSPFISLPQSSLGPGTTYFCKANVDITTTLLHYSTHAMSKNTSLLELHSSPSCISDLTLCCSSSSRETWFRDRKTGFEEREGGKYRERNRERETGSRNVHNTIPP